MIKQTLTKDQTESLIKQLKIILKEDKDIPEPIARQANSLLVLLKTYYFTNF